MPPNEGIFKTDEKEAKKQVRSSRGGAKYITVPQHRKAKTFAVTTSEMLSLSALGPVASVLFGWGVNTINTYWQMTTSSQERLVVGWAAWGLLIGGGIVQLVFWGLLIRVWWESSGD